MAAKGTTLKEIEEMLNHVVKHMATKDEWISSSTLRSNSVRPMSGSVASHPNLL
jgi:hypothetical protein